MLHGKQEKLGKTTGSKSELKIKRVYSKEFYISVHVLEKQSRFDSCDFFLTKQGGRSLWGCFGSSGAGKAPGSAVTNVLMSHYQVPPPSPTK